MKHHLLVLHFDAQCPWQPWVVKQAQRAAGQLGGTVRVVDVAQQPELAARYRLFFPFMTVVDGAIRLPSPTPAEELVRIAIEGLTVPPAAPTTWGPEARAEAIRPLTAGDIADTCHLCIRPDIAFITCIYSTEDGPDYRGQVLERLMEHLQAAGYRQLQVVAGRWTPYPNGPAAFFRQHGFEPVGEVDRVTLREGEEVLLLLRRKWAAPGGPGRQQ